MTAKDAKKKYFSGSLKAEKLNKNTIKKHFSNLDFEVLTINQHFRNAYGKLKSGKKKYFYKIASTRAVARFLKNEIEFNQKIQPILNKKQIDFFQVPKICKTGLLNGKSYFIAEYMPGGAIAHPNIGKTRNLQNYLGNVADICLFLLKLKNIDLKKDNSWKKTADVEKRYLKSISYWYRISKNQEIWPMEGLYDLALSLKGNFKRALAHGDFSPWHLLKGKNNLILIDSELATNYHVLFYDAAHFYHRVYTKTGRRELMREFAQEFRSRLSKNMQKHFDKTFPAVVAYRTMSCFSELIVSKQDQRTIKYHKRLAKEAVNLDLY